MLQKRRPRNKPLYKKFIRLRENVQYRRKLVKFKMWSNFQSLLTGVEPRQLGLKLSTNRYKLLGMAVLTGTVVYRGICPVPRYAVHGLQKTGILRYFYI